jgi:hypothetical protein
MLGIGSDPYAINPEGRKQLAKAFREEAERMARNSLFGSKWEFF